MPRPPYASGIGAPEEAELAHPGEDLGMDFAAAVPLADVGQDLRLRRTPGRWPGRAGSRRSGGNRSRRCGSSRCYRSGPGHCAIASLVPHAAAPGILAGWTHLSEAHLDAPASGLDLAAIADPNLTPVLGRYFERSWSHGDRPPAVRHRRQGLPRLRQRDRRLGARPSPPGGDHRRSTSRSTG